MRSVRSVMTFRRSAFRHDFSCFDPRISRSRVHVPLAASLPHVIRQGVHHFLDLPNPLTIAAVPIDRVAPPILAHEVFEFSAERVFITRDEFSCARRHIDIDFACKRAKPRTPANRTAKARVGSAARRLRLRRSENGRDGARIGSARRKRDGRRADEVQRARDGHALRVRSRVPRVLLDRNAMPDLRKRKAWWPRCARTENGRARW